MKSPGFTPIPLLIAVLIAGVVATVAIPTISERQSRNRTNAMKIDLRDLLAAEQTYYADSSRYVDATTLVRLNRFRSSSGVALPLVSAGAQGWSAIVSYGKGSSTICGIAINTTNPIRRGARDGEPICRVP